MFNVKISVGIISARADVKSEDIKSVDEEQVHRKFRRVPAGDHTTPRIIIPLIPPQGFKPFHKSEPAIAGTKEKAVVVSLP